MVRNPGPLPRRRHPLLRSGHRRRDASRNLRRAPLRRLPLRRSRNRRSPRRRPASDARPARSHPLPHDPPPPRSGAGCRRREGRRSDPPGHPHRKRWCYRDLPRSRRQRGRAERPGLSPQPGACRSGPAVSRDASAGKFAGGRERTGPGKVRGWVRRSTGPSRGGRCMKPSFAARAPVEVGPC